MRFTKIQILNHHYYVGMDNQGYTFIGSPNGDMNEIDKWFNDNLYVEYNDSYKDIKDAITKYLNKESKTIDIKMHMIGTDFQKSVWQELLKIPYGKAITYLEVARSLGNEKMVRSVARAIAKNPLLMVVPCHRVIGSDGNLRGFRAGLEFKKQLLMTENCDVYKNGIK